MLVPAHTPFAGPLTRIHWEDYAVSPFPAGHLTANLFNRATEFVARHKGWLDAQPAPRPITGPQMPVRAADAIGTDPHDGPIRRTFRIGHIAYDEGLVEFLYNGGAHESSPLFVD
jgi:hypothetical protein